MNGDRTQLVKVITEAAAEVAAVLDRHPVSGTGSYPLAEVVTSLAKQHDVLREAVEQHPHPLSADVAGKPDRLGVDLAALMGYLEHIRVLYHRLDDLPSHLRAQAHRDLSATHLRARKLRDNRGRR
ncbi:hypothetical protein V1227_08550 [Lentzea sp. DG1S-22]|uniref:hypothetical protein n=1 Tax=Lentzea sp. DG1S-22 TaxID=3108822 RepID=UPI002E7A629E|nr:hypothetical protein [Lentzea sp. DG1S-22]WVH82786.1 hypothetical protein V1227_08550 [Lentzea sp. DG1S-22]